MKKPMIIMLLCVGILFFLIFAWKTFGNIMLARFLKTRENISTVSTMTAEYSLWKTQEKYFGSIRAVRGVNVTTESPGLVEKIYFKDGSDVKKGDLLVQLDARTEVAALNSLQANTALAATTLRRDRAQYAIQAISKATLDSDEANLKSLTAQTAQQQSLVEKKSIRAPFSGRLGIKAINEGQYVNAGTAVVPLQELDFVQIEFFVPQQQMTTLKVGQPVELQVDTFPNRIFKGKISAVNPVIDTNTRNVQVQANIENPDYALTPGMFASLTVATGAPKQFITLPQTTVFYNPYGNIIYVLKPTDKKSNGHETFIAMQRFVTTGPTRGDQIAILSGVKQGEQVVTSGQLKLTNNAKVMVNNETVPTNNPAPMPKEE